MEEQNTLLADHVTTQPPSSHPNPLRAVGFGIISFIILLLVVGDAYYAGANKLLSPKSIYDSESMKDSEKINANLINDSKEDDKPLVFKPKFHQTGLS